MKNLILFISLFTISSFCATAQMQNEFRYGNMQTTCTHDIEVVWLNTVTSTLRSQSITTSPNQSPSRAHPGQTNEVVYEVRVTEILSNTQTSWLILNPNSTNGSVTFGGSTSCTTPGNTSRFYWHQGPNYTGINIVDN